MREDYSQRYTWINPGKSCVESSGKTIGLQPKPKASSYKKKKIINNLNLYHYKDDCLTKCS